MQLRFHVTTLVLSLLLAIDAAGASTAAPDCRAHAPEAVVTAAVIVVDTTFDASGSRAWLDQALDDLIASGSVAIRVGSFANAGGREGPTLGKWLIRDAPPDDEWLRTHRRLDVARIQQCQHVEIQHLHDELQQSLDAVLNSRVGTARRSDIAASLAVMAPALKQMQAMRRWLIVVSDGLEHTREQDFYSQGQPRSIKSSAELRVLQQRRIVADLHGVQVIWTGLGTSRTQMEWTSQQALTQYWIDVVQLWGGEAIELAAIPTTTIAQSPTVGQP